MSTLVQLTAPSGIGSCNSENYLERLQGGGRGSRSLPSSARLEVGPAGAIPTVSVVPTTSARPKPSNAAIPYARTSPTQLDAGTIAMLHAPRWSRAVPGAERGPVRSIVGHGTSSFCTVKSIAQLNAHLANLTEQDNKAEYDEATTVWSPDGVVINYDGEEQSASAKMAETATTTWQIANVAISGPTPMLNEAGTDDMQRVRNEDVVKHKCWLSGEGSPARLYVALGRKTEAGKTRAKYIAFSTNVLKGSTLDGYELLVAWRIGRIMDSNLNLKFRDSALVFVDISPPLTAPNSWAALSLTLPARTIPTSAHSRTTGGDVRTYKSETLLEALQTGFHSGKPP
jgi:hypothetical protein